MVSGIENADNKSVLVPKDEGGESLEGHGRSEDEHLKGQRIGAYDRARGAGLSYGGPRGPEALRVLRRPRSGGHERLHGDARYEAGTPLSLHGRALRVRGRRAHGAWAV